MKQQVVQEIEETFSRLNKAISKFSDKQFNTIPFEGSWTAGQVSEHIIKSISGIPDRETQLTDRRYDERIEAIRKMFLDFNLKFKTAQPLEPEKSSHHVEETLKHLQRLKELHLHAANTKDLTALCLDMELPTFGHLTRYEWLRFMMVHALRHTIQIERIFPMV
jgi:hypothetical protein